MAQDLLRSDPVFVGSEEKPDNLCWSDPKQRKGRDLSALEPHFYQARGHWVPFGHFSGFKGLLSSGSPLPLLLESVLRIFAFSWKMRVELFFQIEGKTAFFSLCHDLGFLS